MSIFDLSERLGRVILASASPRRAQLLRELGVDPVIAPQDVDEAPRANETPRELVGRLASLKGASALGGARAGDCVIAADTIVAAGREVLGKPADEADARRMLGALSGATHEVLTGVFLAIKGEGGAVALTRSFVETSAVSFFELSSEDIDAYVACGECADKAGSYGIQGKGRLLVRGIEGDYLNVVGLPVARLARELEALLAQAGPCEEPREGAGFCTQAPLGAPAAPQPQAPGR